jgi:hypothetical protein
MDNIIAAIFVAPDIAAALKIIISWKRTDFWHPVL